jgi:hypothetical protein
VNAALSEPFHSECTQRFSQSLPTTMTFLQASVQSAHPETKAAMYLLEKSSWNQVVGAAMQTATAARATTKRMLTEAPRKGLLEENKDRKEKKSFSKKRPNRDDPTSIAS